MTQEYLVTALVIGARLALTKKIVMSVLSLIQGVEDKTWSRTTRNKERYVRSSKCFTMLMKYFTLQINDSILGTPWGTP